MKEPVRYIEDCPGCKFNYQLAFIVCPVCLNLKYITTAYPTATIDNRRFFIGCFVALSLDSIKRLARLGFSKDIHYSVEYQFYDSKGIFRLVLYIKKLPDYYSYIE